jgi:hypothetical protein
VVRLLDRPKRAVVIFDLTGDLDELRLALLGFCAVIRARARSSRLTISAEPREQRGTVGA